jgi:hypothetical protein
MAVTTSKVKHPNIDNKIYGSSPPYTQQRMETAEKKRKNSFRGLCHGPAYIT